jgi:endonuclease G
MPADLPPEQQYQIVQRYVSVPQLGDWGPAVTARRIFVQIRLLLFLVGSALAATAATAANCSAAERHEADRWLWLNQRDRNASLEQNLPWGAPAPVGPVSNERELVQRDYVIGYDADLRVPLWTAERVTGADLGKVGRSDCFRKDVRLKSADASTPSDYSEPIFDQGHVTPSADMTMSKLAVHNSFIMSNMTPQFCQFNRGVWQILEEIARRWAVQYGIIYVTSGSIFDRDGNGVRDPDDAALRMTSNNGRSRVAIPSAFYKVIAAKDADGTVETVSILLPNDQTDLDGAEAIAYLGQHVTSLARIEQLGGIDLFPKAPSSLVEHSALWPFAGDPPRSLAQGAQCTATAGAVIH